MKLFYLDSYRSTFRETSYDRTKGESLLGDQKKRVVNFDAYAASVSKELRTGENLSSADALVVSGEEILLLEFKNQKLSQIEAKRIQKKAFDSLILLLLLEDLDSLSPAAIKRKVSFLVLYREDDIPSYTRWMEQTSQLARGEGSLHFGLGKYRQFYNRVLTMTAEEFFRSELYRQIDG